LKHNERVEYAAFNLAVPHAVSTGGWSSRRANVGGFPGRITGFDLQKTVAPTTESADDMTRLAELAAGRRIMSQGSVVPISSTEWTERWEQLPHTQDVPSWTPTATPVTDRTGP
jgi:hypothetical protein